MITGTLGYSKQSYTIQPAMKMDAGGGNATIMHSTATVFVEAENADQSHITSTTDHYDIAGLTGSDTHNIYGQGGPMTLKKQDFRGVNKSYEFNPFTER